MSISEKLVEGKELASNWSSQPPLKKGDFFVRHLKCVDIVTGGINHFRNVFIILCSAAHVMRVNPKLFEHHQAIHSNAHKKDWMRAKKVSSANVGLGVVELQGVSFVLIFSTRYTFWGIGEEHLETLRITQLSSQSVGYRIVVGWLVCGALGFQPAREEPETT